MKNFSNSELRRSARGNLKRYFLQAVLMSIVIMIFSGSLGNVANRELQKWSVPLADVWGQVSSDVITMIIRAAVISILIRSCIVSILDIFVFQLFEVGKNRFYMESRELGHSSGVKRLFWAFGSGHYLNVVKIMFLMNLKRMLWMMLLILPGVYKSYEYAMIPYILAENPEISSKDAFRLSRKMMSGRRFKLFWLETSIFIWLVIPALLMQLAGVAGLILMAVGVLILLPYADAAVAEFYACLRPEIQETDFQLNGFIQRREAEENVSECE